MMFFVVMVFCGYAGYNQWRWGTPALTALAAQPVVIWQLYSVASWRRDIGLYYPHTPLDFAIALVESSVVTLAFWYAAFGAGRALRNWRTKRLA